MPTLSEYQLLGLDEMTAGLYDEILVADALMAALEFKSIQGNSLLYNRELTNPTTAFHVVGDVWTDSEPTFTQKSAALKILGTQSPLDKFAMQTLGNVNSQEAILFGRMAKSVSEKLKNTIITGEPSSQTSEFEGLDSLVRSETRMMAMDDGVVDGPGTAETELTLDRFDSMMDLIEPGEAMALIMNKTMRRKLSSLSRSSGGGVLMNNIDFFGHQISTYNHIPILVNDYITNAEQYDDSGTWPSSTATTIFAVKFGEANAGYTILHNGPVFSPEIQRLGIKETANEELYRIVVYIQAATWSSKAVAALGGIDSTA